MKLKSTYILREMGDTHILINEGEAVNMTRVIHVNESAAFLWRMAEGKDFSEEWLMEQILSEYDATPEQASDGARAMVQSWRENELLEEE